MPESEAPQKKPLSPFQIFHLREFVKELLQSAANHLLELIWPSNKLPELQAAAGVTKPTTQAPTLPATGTTAPTPQPEVRM